MASHPESSPRQFQTQASQLPRCGNSKEARPLTSAASPLGGRTPDWNPTHRTLYSARSPNNPRPGNPPRSRRESSRAVTGSSWREEATSGDTPEALVALEAASGPTGSPSPADCPAQALAPLPLLLLSSQRQRPRAAGVAVAAGARVPPPPALSRRLL